MRKFKRKPRVVWLPADPYNAIGQQPGAAIPGPQDSIIKQHILQVPVGTGGESVVNCVPLVADGTAAANAASISATLADFEQSGYRLRRIVGKIFCGVQLAGLNAEGATSDLWVTAGIIVLRTNDTGAGPELLDPVELDYGPDNAQNIDDPWVWRRSWLLQNSAQAVLNAQIGNYPYSWPERNTWQSGTYDGPHVDQKTARVIGPDERLYLVLQATNMNAGIGAQEVNNVQFNWHFRFLASMRSSLGNRRNASR